MDGLPGAHAASLLRSGFLRITDRVDEIAGCLDVFLATGERDALFLGSYTPSVAARGRISDGVGQLHGISLGILPLKEAVPPKADMLDTAARMVKAGYADAAATQFAEARRRLSRLLILHDVKELGTLPIRARLALGRIEASHDQMPNARKRFGQVASQKRFADWAQIGQAELKLLDGRRTEAARLFQGVATNKQADPQAAADARLRFSEVR